MTKSQKINQSVQWYIHNGEIENNELVELFKYIADILNIKTISQYANDKKISYQAATKHKVESFKLSGVRFIIDNE